MTGRLVDMSFSLNRKQRITLEVDSDFRSLWDKLNQEPLLDIEIKKHRNKRSHSANAYFHVLVNKIAAETWRIGRPCERAAGCGLRHGCER